MRYSIAASMINTNEDKLLEPGKELTRADVALILYNFLEYRENRRTQSLLDSSEQEIIFILEKLEANNITEAEYSSARTLLYARGANSVHPNEPVVQGTVKIAEGFRALVQAYRAGLSWNLNDVITYAGEAWRLANEAKEINADLNSIAVEMQRIAKSMADDARGKRGDDELTR